MAIFMNALEKLGTQNVKRLCILLALLLPSLIMASASSGQKKTVFFLTLPKSGTHLLKKVLPMILEKDILYFTNIDQDPFNPPHIPDDQYFIFNHVYPGFSKYKEWNKDKCIKVLLIRDPRDAVISFMHWLPKEKHWGPWTPQEFIDDFNSLSQEERLTRSILFPDKYLGIPLFCREALEWMKDPNVFILRFEDIVGPQGGGSRATQEKTIQALSEHIGVHLSQERIAFIADNLFGGSFTFREGKIGTWSKYFNEAHKKLFKSTMGYALIKMGFEANEDW